MKKQYKKPKIEKYGTVKTITKEKFGTGIDASHMFDEEG